MIRPRVKHRHQQQGAVILTVALVMFFLMGFMAIALDFGRLFIVRTELQTALDSCALAAAQELNGAPDALTRATNAGRTAGNLNKVHFQSESAGILDTEVQFSSTFSKDAVFSHAFSPAADAKYVRCIHTKADMRPWLLQSMRAFSGNTAYSARQSVAAVAVASLAPAQTNCLIPVGLCQKSSTNPMGFSAGEWIAGVTNDQDDLDASGQFRWIDFSGNGGGAREIKDLLSGNGQCGLPGLETEVGKAGKTNGAVDAWNTRFGIYKGSYSSPDNQADQTGYAWYEKSDTPPSSLQGRYQDKTSTGFNARFQAKTPYQGDNKGPDTTGLKTQGKVDTFAYAQGGNRRVAAAPVVDCSTMTLKGVACVLLLHPLEINASGKNSKMWLEFISDATSATGNPCATTGLAGSGTNGVRVPALVQ